MVGGGETLEVLLLGLLLEVVEGLGVEAFGVAGEAVVVGVDGGSI